jgi:Haem-binding domain
MKKLATRIAIAAAAVLVAIQLIPLRPSNAATESSQTVFAIETMPPKVETILHTSCMDCHSEQTRWPWYSHLAPVSWLVVHDVHKGRHEMNFSRWGSYSAKKRDQLKENICDQLMNEDMPDGFYAFVHRQARLTPEQREAVCSWTNGAPSD